MCPKTGSPVCYNCGNYGHLSKDCDEPIQGKACYNCGETGHLLRNCKVAQPAEGATAPEKSEVASEPAVGNAPAATESTDSPVAASVLVVASTPLVVEAVSETAVATPAPAVAIPTAPASVASSTDVPSGPASTSSLECYKCGTVGHISRFCPNSAGTGSGPTASSRGRGGRSSRSQSCYSCGRIGHVSRECTKGQKCYNCGDMGHLSKECSQAQEKVCYKCKGPGHISSQCSEPDVEA